MLIKPDRQTVCSIGLFYACYRLSQLGWKATLAAGKLPGVDVTADRADPACSISIKVRSLSKVDAVGLGARLKDITADYWIVLNNVIGERPWAFILSADDVRHRIKRNEKDGRPSYWLEIRDYRAAPFRENWQRLAGSYRSGDR